MTAGEDQAQALVLDVLLIHFGWVGSPAVQFVCQGPQRGVEARPLADEVNRLEAAGRDEPGARVGRDTLPLPLFERRYESIVQCFLRKVEVTQQMDQCGKNTPRLRTIDSLHEEGYLFRRFI